MGLAIAVAVAGCGGSPAVVRSGSMRCAALKRDALEQTSKLLLANGYRIGMAAIELGVIQAERSAGGGGERWMIRYTLDTIFLRPSRVDPGGKVVDVNLEALSPADAAWVLPIADGVAEICGIVVPGRPRAPEE